MSDSSFVAAGENGSHFGGAGCVLQRHADCRPGLTGGAAADGIHDHEDSPAVRPQQAFDILRGPRLFDTVLGQITAHGE